MLPGAEARALLAEDKATSNVLAGGSVHRSMLDTRRQGI